MKATVFIATSLDGFIARQDGDIDWLGGPSKDGEDFGYQDLMDTIDYLVMGRNTYEKVLTFGPWPYSKPVVVLTSRPIRFADERTNAVESMLGSPANVVGELSRRGAKHIYVDGGKTIQDFLNANLIQRLVITKIPILLGTGIPLFGPLRHDIKLQHVNSRAFANGYVQCEYQVESSHVSTWQPQIVPERLS